MQDPANTESGRSGWGGVRQGAGRKKKFTGKRFMFVSTPEVEAILERQGNAKSEFINAAIMAFARVPES